MPSNSKPRSGQRANRQPLQVLRRLRLHAGGDFLAEQFQKQIRHYPNLGSYLPIGVSSQASQQAWARARTRPI